MYCTSEGGGVIWLGSAAADPRNYEKKGKRREKRKNQKKICSSILPIYLNLHLKYMYMYIIKDFDSPMILERYPSIFKNRARNFLIYQIHKHNI